MKFGIYLARKQLTLELNPPIHDFIRLGYIQQLLSLLESFMTDENIVVNNFLISVQNFALFFFILIYVNLQYEILWCFINLTSVPGIIACNHLILPGPLILFDKILKNHSHNDILVQIVWLLGHLSGESIEFRDIILNSNVYQKVLSSLRHPVLASDLIRQSTWLLSNLLRGKPSPSLKNVHINFLFNQCLSLLK